jgi:hypothetical protein
VRVTKSVNVPCGKKFQTFNVKELDAYVAKKLIYVYLLTMPCETSPIEE